jgi:hypothetical protein
MARPPIPPTFGWALGETEAYLAGLLSTFELFEDVSALSAYYRQVYPADVPPEDELYDFYGTVWSISGRVLRGKDSEQDLIDLLQDWLPDVRNAAVREGAARAGGANGHT